MFVVLAALWISVGSWGTLAITVSPNPGILENASAKFIPNFLSINKTFDNNGSIPDRNRRLVPYLTFYTPQDFSLAQKYSYSAEEHQQHQNAPVYQTNHPQRLQGGQHGQGESHQLPLRYPHVPVDKQKYHSVSYGSRYQNSHSDTEDIQHQVVPIYPPSNLHPQPHFPTRVNLTPFVPSNKLPGKFTPIIYVHPIDAINYNKQSQLNKGSLVQYSVVPNQHHNYEEDEQISVDQNATPNPKTSNAVLSTIRPFYNLLHELPLRQMHYQSLPALHESENSVHLTPQQKYVKYLREQLQSQQQQHYEQQERQQQVQQKEHAFIISTSPAPSPDGAQGVGSNLLSYEKPEGNLAIYQVDFESAPTGQYNYGKGLPPKQSSTRPVNVGSPTSAYPARFNNNGAYLEVLISKTHQNTNLNPEENSNFHEIVGTTAAPVKITSPVPVYNHKKSETVRVIEIPKSVKSHSNPVPIKSNQNTHRETPKHKKLSQITSSRKPIIQHLTETTQGPLPILTTYHPNIIVTKPKYYSSTSTTRPFKAKIAQKYKPIRISRPTIQTKPMNKSPEEQNLPTNFTHSSLVDILHKLQDNNQLPKTFTPDNIDNSIRTLIRILNNLKQSHGFVDTNPPQHQDENDEYYENVADIDTNRRGPNSGRFGIDYPALAEIPPTSFSCKEQRYKGFFGDPETHCQVWHYCDLNGGQASFLCPNGTIFSQVALTCDWWFNVKCSSTAQLYVLNERLYKYILPLTPKFPEDYSGPLVDKYLALKFKEMEEKLRREKAKGKEGTDKVKDDISEEEQENESDSEEVSTTQNNEQIKIIQDRNRDTVTGVAPTTSVPSLQSMPIVVTSTEEPFSVAPTSARTSVESEKVEVIEIKNDGTSGRIIQTRLYNSGLKK